MHLLFSYFVGKYYAIYLIREIFFYVPGKF